MWVSSQGVVANIHYDATHNFYLQVKGRKRVILAPPSQWKYLCIFFNFDFVHIGSDSTDMHPQPHPSDRQSQVNFTVLTTSALGMNTIEDCHAMLQRFPKLQNLKGTLNPYHACKITKLTRQFVGSPTGRGRCTIHSSLPLPLL